MSTVPVPDPNTLFTQNRTEEIGDDVWRHFVVPPFFNRLDLREARKPRIIEGGRGCGKTMLLRYLSHRSTFSPDRVDIPASALDHIGLYWRADTQFARLMRGRGIESAIWATAFEHLIALAAAGEVLASLASIAASRCTAVAPEDLARLAFDELAPYDERFKGGYESFRRTIRVMTSELERWVANAERLTAPIFLPGVRFVTSVIHQIRQQLSGLGTALFFVYIDEYENLELTQQEIINTYLKHSEQPLIFNIAVKRHGITTVRTTGTESITDVADYRRHDLEAYLTGDFDLFAAEVLMLTLALSGWSVPIDIAMLRDPNRLPERQQAGYRDRVNEFVRSMLPGLSHTELAQQTISDSGLRRRLERRMERSLLARHSSLDASRFIVDAVPAASITAMALLARPTLSDLEILDELQKAAEGAPNRFTGSTNWIHNNLIGCLLALYDADARVCPFYAGFDAYCRISRGNLRHFLELCHKALQRVGSTRSGEQRTVPAVPIFAQAEAAREASAGFLGQIRSFGTHGNLLYTFVLRLGSLFALAHQRPSQSEPEISHFSIASGAGRLTEAEQSFMDEAIKWSVLYEEEATKVKAIDQAPAFEYVLNPIYAPYFGITFRKIRKIDLSLDELRVLISGTYTGFQALIRDYRDRWSVAYDELNPTLFSHLSDTIGDE